MTPAGDICALLQARAASGRDAFEIAATTLLGIIKTLKRDARFANIPRVELELLLVNDGRRLEDMLFEAMRGRIHIDDAQDAVQRCLGDDE
jgi:hypothetical protein